MFLLGRLFPERKPMGHRFAEWISRQAWWIWAWVLGRQPWFDYMRDYWDELVKQWNKHLFETTSPIIVAFLLWWFFVTPFLAVAVFVVVWVFLLAGYYAWRGDHVQLVPRFNLNDYRVSSPTHVMANVRSLFVQVLPRCHTGARVIRVRGYLLRVMSWSPVGWQPTELDQPLDLLWSFYDTRPRNLEPGINQWLNICFITNMEQFIHLETRPMPAAQRTLFRANNSYRFDIRVTATNCPAQNISLVISLGGTWDSLTVDPELTAAV